MRFYFGNIDKRYLESYKNTSLDFLIAQVQYVIYKMFIYFLNGKIEGMLSISVTIKDRL